MIAVLISSLATVMAMAQGIRWNRGYMNAWSVEDTASFLREEIALSDDAGLRANHVNGRILAALVDGHDNGHARILLPVDRVLIMCTTRIPTVTSNAAARKV
jgi:hypothetical protein